MAAKKNSSGMAGGFLLFLGSLLYLYVVFTWYTSGGAASPWLGAAYFLAPFVAALAIVSSVTLFFMSLGSMAGKMMGDKMMMNVLWKFVIIGAITTLIITGQAVVSSWFWIALVGFLLTYIGAMMVGM